MRLYRGSIQIERTTEAAPLIFASLHFRAAESSRGRGYGKSLSIYHAVFLIIFHKSLTLYIYIYIYIYEVITLTVIEAKQFHEYICRILTTVYYDLLCTR